MRTFRPLPARAVLGYVGDYTLLVICTLLTSVVWSCEAHLIRFEAGSCSV